MKKRLLLKPGPGPWTQTLKNLDPVFQSPGSSGSGSRVWVQVLEVDRGEILDFMLPNLDLDEDIEVSSDVFADEEKHELVLQEVNISVWTKKVKESKKYPQLYLLMRIIFRE